MIENLTNVSKISQGKSVGESGKVSGHWAVKINNNNKLKIMRSQQQGANHTTNTYCKI